MPEPGTVLAGRYRVVRKLGSGGMAVVWAAEDEVLGRTVAVKRLHAPTDESSRRFTREARLGAGLKHPGLVTVFDVVEEGLTVLLVMEHVDGPSLSGLLDDRRLEPAEALRILGPVAAALDHAHGQGVVHRDVKPANILVADDGRVKLADLGIASAAEATQITARGAVLGTPAYLAPEQLEGERATPASDIYALAAVAFEMLSGRPAVRGRNTLEILAAVREGPPPDLTAAWPEAPPAAAAVLARGMARDPGERPASAGELVDELRRAVAPSEPEPAPEPEPEPAPEPKAAPATRVLPARVRQRRSRAPWAALLIVPLVMGAVALLVLTGGDDDPEPRATATPAAEATATPEAEETPSATAAPASAAAEAVRAFYERAAADDFAGAWRLAGPELRAAFGSQEAMASQLASLESIEFPALETVDESGDTATVRVRTVARHTDRVDRCRGTIETARRGSRWVMNRPAVQCDSSNG